MVQKVIVGTNKNHQEDFLKVAVLNRFTKRAISGFFVENTFHSFQSAESEQN